MTHNLDSNEPQGTSTSRDRERMRQERIRTDPDYRAKYLERKRIERQKHGKYPCQTVATYEAERKRRWRAENPDENKKLRVAHRAVESALRSGELVRPESCQRCGVPCKPEAHHHSYERECHLDVEWLCTVCHGTADVERKRNGN